MKVEHFDYTPNELMMDDQGDTTTNSQDDKEVGEYENILKQIQLWG